MGTLTNNEDPDEMPHNAAFHQGLQCLLRQIQSSEKEIKYTLEIITCEPSIYTMDYPHYFIVCSCMENSIGLKRVYSFKNIYGTFSQVGHNIFCITVWHKHGLTLITPP